MKNIFQRMLAFGLAASLVLPLPALAADLDTEADAPQQISETTEAAGESTEETGLWETEPAAEETEAPAEETEAPTEETEAPTEETEAPTEETEAPTEETEAPTEETEEVLTEDAEALLEETGESFSCYTYDAQGNVLDGYWSAEREAWYLFLTSTQSVSDTKLYYTGTVTAASAGELDAETGTVTGAFTASGDQVELTLADGSVCSVVAMQSSLPSVYITLNGTTLDQVHADKDVKYKGNSVSIMDPSGSYNLTAEGSVEFKGRGNSTWRLYGKKGYQIKFDSKTSVLGMGKAKKWVLLANAGDDSMMRTQLIYRMAEQLDMGFVPSFEYVDLWIDGEYRGTYIIGEKVEIGSTRLELTNDTGALFEHDEAFYTEEDYWFYSTMLQRHFVLKEISDESEASISAAMADFEAAVDTLTGYLYSTPSQDVTLEALSKIIDVDSFVRYFLVNEYALNRESFATSFYWYKDGPEDVIHLGPIWDFDTCMGNDGAANTESFAQNHVLMEYLLAAPAFYQRTQELYGVYKDTFASMTADTAVLSGEIASSADMNYTRWNVLGKPNPKGGTDFHNSFAEAVSALRGWLQGRETSFPIVKSTVITSVVSDDCYTMELCFQDGQEHSEARFGVWSLKDGQDDLKWYTAKKSSDGSWRYTVDLTKHNTAGMYRINVHVDNGTKSVASGRNYVKTARGPLYQTSAVVSDDCQTMTITLQDSGLCSAVSFAVWSADGGQNDLRWYTGQKDKDGLWTATVDLKRHESAGMYYIHVYSGTGSSRKQVDDTTVNVAFAVSGPVLEAQVSADCTTITLMLKKAPDCERIWAPVWSEKNGQDDLCWYELRKISGDTWMGSVDLRQHGSAGNYFIHIYGGTTAPETVLTDGTAYVSKAPDRRILPVISEDFSTMDVTVRDVGEWQNLWVPVWSEENGQDDIQWYRPVKQADGTYRVTVDLCEHNSTGLYHVRVYGGSENPETLVTYTTVTVDKLPENRPHLKVTVGEDAITIAVKNIDGDPELWIPVWSEENGQDDIQWYRPVKQADGTYLVTVDLREYDSLGQYNIHVYSGTENPETLETYTIVTVEKLPKKLPAMEVTVDDATLTVIVKNVDIDTELWIPVWSEENGQDDIRWYRPVPQPDGTWKAVAHLSEHDSLGAYNIHAYTGTGTPTELLAYTTVMVERYVAAPLLKAEISGDTMTVTLKNAGEYGRIWLAVWGAEPGKDGVQWYPAGSLGGGNWKCVVDLTPHGDIGPYHVHAYAGQTGPVELVTYTDVFRP